MWALNHRHVRSAALWAALAGGRRRHLLLLQLRRARLADPDRRPLEPHPAGDEAGAGAAAAAALPLPADDPGGNHPAGRPGGGDAGRPVRLRPQLRQSRRDEHLRARLADRGAGRLVDARLPARSTRWRAPDRPGGGDRRDRPACRPHLVGAAAGTGPAARLCRLRDPLPRLAANQRRLRAGQGADGRGAAGDAADRPPAADRTRLEAGAAARLDGSGGRLRRRRRLLELPGAARRSGRPARPWWRAARLPADPPRQAGPLRRSGPLRRLRAARRRHPRAAGRVPRPRSLRQPGEAVRHRRRLQPDRLRLLLARHPRPLPLRDHRPGGLGQPGAAQLQADRRHPLLRPLEADRQDPARPPGPARGHGGGGAGPAAPRRRSASCSPTRAAPRSSPGP